MLRTALLTLTLVAAPATAATYTVDLTGVIANTIVNNFTFAGIAFQSGGLELTGFTPFTVEQGDDIVFTIALDGSFVVPKSFATPGYGQFFGVNFNNSSTQPVEPVNTTGTILFSGLTGDFGNPALAGCGNCIGLIAGRPFGEAFGLTGASGTGLIDTLAAPFEITSISISYQINPSAFNAVPEPATWAMMIGGFFLSGGLVRARRPRARVTA